MFLPGWKMPFSSQRRASVWKPAHTRHDGPSPRRCRLMNFMAVLGTWILGPIQALGGRMLSLGSQFHSVNGKFHSTQAIILHGSRKRLWFERSWNRAHQERFSKVLQMQDWEIFYCVASEKWLTLPAPFPASLRKGARELQRIWDPPGHTGVSLTFIKLCAF